MAYAIDTAAAISDLEHNGGLAPEATQAIIRVVTSTGDDLATKSDLGTLKSELKEDIAGVKVDIANVRVELTEDIAEIKEDIAEIRSSLSFRSFAAQVATAVGTVVVVLAALRYLAP